MTDTIFALATPPGRAGVAVIRVSGPQALTALAHLNASHDGPVPEPAERMMVRRLLRDPQSGRTIDDALVVAFRAPRSFTGEDVVEFHLHGSRAVVTRMLEVLGAVPGLRPAEAGAFTRRAFDNGKIDLTRAEGLADLIDADTQGQLDQALRQAGGRLQDKARAWRAQLLSLRAEIEAALDFADEGDVVDLLPTAFLAGVGELQNDITDVLADGRRGEIMRDGVPVAIVGPPNAGKSSLLNALVGREAAIVTSMPGTTRDIISVTLDLDGVPVVLNDTAGLRQTDDIAEAEGVRRAEAAASAAAVVVRMVPHGRGSDGIGALGQPVTDANKTTVHVASRIDEVPPDAREALPLDPTGAAGFIALSVVSGEGLDQLVARLTEIARATVIDRVPPYITNARQRVEIERCRDGVAEAHQRLTARAGGDELLAEDLRRASDALGRLVGAIDPEELLGEIFGRFCIGK